MRVPHARVLGGTDFTRTRDVAPLGSDDSTREGQITAAMLELRGINVVYYVRDGGLVKIGTTRDLANRMRKLRLPLTCLLALEPGDIELERLRHAEFSAVRATRDEAPNAREWYIPAPELLDHINVLRRGMRLSPLAW
jgi:hypothetical protein